MHITSLIEAVNLVHSNGLENLVAKIENLDFSRPLVVKKDKPCSIHVILNKQLGKFHYHWLSRDTTRNADDDSWVTHSEGDLRVLAGLAILKKL